MLRDVSLDTDTVSQNFARRIDIAAEISVSRRTKIADPRLGLENFSLGPDLDLDGFVSFNTADSPLTSSPPPPPRFPLTSSGVDIGGGIPR